MKVIPRQEGLGQLHQQQPPGHGERVQHRQQRLHGAGTEGEVDTHPPGAGGGPPPPPGGGGLPVIRVIEYRVLTQAGEEGEEVKQFHRLVLCECKVAG